MPSVAINPSNLWRLGNTAFLLKLAKRARGKHYPFVVGDVVRVISGREAGKAGRVRRILPELDQVIVQGVHTRIAISRDPDGTETPYLVDRAIPVEHVQLADPVSLKPVSVEARKVETPFGYVKFERFITGTDTPFPFPTMPRSLAPPGPKDTLVSDAFEVTWKPSLNKHPLPYGLFL